MSPKDIWTHLRLPFSVFLSIPFVMALLGQNWATFLVLKMAVILHLLVYPASNAHNSYYDKDTDSIGGVKNPPPVTRALFWVAWILDLVGLLLSLTISFRFFAFVLGYCLMSQAYSHPATRLKKYPWLSFLAVVIFQGGWIVAAVRMELKGDQAFTALDWALIVLASLNLCGAYPLSQIYQHKADQERGDRTLSLNLGTENTWKWTQIFMSASAAGLIIFIYEWSKNLNLLGPSLVWLVLIFGPSSVLLKKKLGLGPKMVWNFEKVMTFQWISATTALIFWIGLDVFSLHGPTW